MSHRSVRGRIWPAAILFGAAMLAGAPAWALRPAVPPKPEVVPPSALYLGKTYGDWSVAWWQHMLSIPANDNPLMDWRGTNARLKQSGPVVFLGGTWGGTGYCSRYVQIPVGTSLFFPIAAFVTDNGGYDPPGPEGTMLTRSELRCRICPLADSVQRMYLTVDGGTTNSLTGNRVLSPAFEYDLPENSLWETNGLKRYHFHASQNAVADGYYVMLRPLSEGDHVVSFGVKGKTGITYYVRVTYSDDVAPNPPPEGDAPS
jgi:hypothetical protein